LSSITPLIAVAKTAPQLVMQQGLVIDDHPIVREGIKALLQKAVPSLAITTSPGTDGVFEEVCGRRWAVVVVDINLPGHHGLDIVKKARSCCPETPILVFSLYAEEQYADRALRAGAVAYISKERPPSALVESVKAALRGETVKRPPVRHPMLSGREIQVLRLLVRGIKRRDIARALEINEKTVSTYKTRLLQKLGLRNLVDLVRYAVDEHVVD
jgi:DNA-binding NarL/FixJ family response regulator